MTDTSRAHVVRQSPSGRKLGSLGFARLSLSKEAAYVDGVGRQIPFDTIDEMSPGFGELVVGGGLNAAGAFRVTSTGVYLVLTTLGVSDPGTSVLLIQLAAGIPIGGDKTDSNAISVSGNAFVTSLDGTDGDIVSELEVVGASGNIQTATTCLIVQVG